MKDAHEEETHTCEECGTHFYSNSRLKKHIKMNSSQNQRKCYYFNSDKICPYEALGCKFLHEYNSNCKFGKTCRRHMCPFRHINSETLDWECNNCDFGLLETATCTLHVISYHLYMLLGIFITWISQDRSIIIRKMIIYIIQFSTQN